MSAVGNANSLRFSALMKPFSSNRNRIKEFFLPIFINCFEANKDKDINDKNSAYVELQDQ